MQNLYIRELGIKYLHECLNRFNGSTGYLLLFFLLCVFLYFKGSEKEKKLFVPVAVIMGITVYNPLFPVIISKVTDVSNEYYRFFWITPVIVLVPYMITKFILFIFDKENNDTNKKLYLVLGIVVIIFCSSFVYKDGFKIAENIYKMPNELIEISEIIHADSNDEYPKAFMDYEYNMMMRQYDPKMLLTIDREDYLYAVSRDYSTDMIYDKEKPQYRILAFLARGQVFETKTVLDGFDMTGTEYIVLETGNQAIDRLLNAGLSKVAETENRTILKYELKDKKPFELVDYSEVYANGW